MPKNSAPWWKELTSHQQALDSIVDIFGNVENATQYATMAMILTERTEFIKSLCALSSDIWDAYLNIQQGGNRLTRAIQFVAAQYGFQMYLSNQHVVYIDQVDEEKFLKNLADKILWKDSFGFGHGEFSHSYQWLAIGKMLNWGQHTAGLYSKCGEIKSKKAIWILSNKKVVKQQHVSIWQWLVDAVPVSEELKNEDNLSEVIKYNQHCFTKETFRTANEIQKVLLKNQDWFLGYYAKRRSNELDTLSQVQLFIDRVEPDKRGKFQPREQLTAQQRALKTKYDSKVKFDPKGTLDGGVFSGFVSGDNFQKPADLVTFHNKPGMLRQQRTY
jgi:hypothetical protein